ncbi:MAG: septum formation protein Maf [Silicimonas sp.]|nr:septum formation protein Maf [Silicimonas sp.]
MADLILASSSTIRAELLRRAGVDIEIVPARVDEQAIKDALVLDGAPARDIADALAEAKAAKIGRKHPDKLVLGCDQVLEFDGRLLSKPESPTEAIETLMAMAGQRHSLFSAAVIQEDGRAVWRHVGVARLWMREASENWITDYVARNWESIQHSVGAYKLEEEGVRLFSRIEGDHFNILGMPLLEILSYLTLKGTLPQ